MIALMLALVVGATVALAQGGLGGGGSILAVPALIYLLHFTPAAATTASLLVIPTSVTALTGHARDGNVAWHTGLFLASAGIMPAMLAGAATGHLPQSVLTIAFAVVAGAAALSMLHPRDGEPSGRVHPGTASAAGAGLGAVTGFLAVPTLVSVLGLSMRRAVGTNLLVITVNSLAAAAARASTGVKLAWAVIAPFTAAALLGAWDGKRLSNRIKRQALQRLFAYVLLAVAVLMLIDAVV
ncbi:sulfite exporter TauE/SafE family protein [Streptomyces ferrugineus]|uniref:Probable membrane transporter protein n=1 Tax=Streptomyces ferrugineus TaxID=1413221 RepID=A0A7M2SCW8_9ACTN|nr:sulfite exporter TauE/SafE family protein [Streptomyces ferrugineus]QOV33243.1 sulfite exporter TauE/SafE family protein [Streptomyces ferrugineus]